MRSALQSLHSYSRLYDITFHCVLLLARFSRILCIRESARIPWAASSRLVQPPTAWSPTSWLLARAAQTRLTSHLEHHTEGKHRKEIYLTPELQYAAQAATL